MPLVTIRIKGETDEDRIFKNIKEYCNENYQDFELEVSGSKKTLKHNVGITSGK